MVSQPQIEGTVPPCPQGLCISRADFLRQDFSVDKFFIEQSVRETPLDTLRDDLGLYLKVLRSSMIELINQDYADFVNLSTNLVGLDKGILALSAPLQQFQQEILTVNSEIGAGLQVVREGLARQAALREDKASLASLRQTSLAIAKIERVVEGEVSTDTAERLATEINQLQFSVWKLEDSSLVQEQYKPRLSAVCDRLHSWLDTALLEEVHGDGAGLSRLCRVYSSIGRVEGAEAVVREGLVRPLVTDIISAGGELRQICNSLLKILPEHLGPLLRLTTDSRRLVGGSLQGFHFLENSYWPEVVDQFQQHLGHIHSAGNPEEFHKNYTAIQELLTGLEQHCSCESSLDRLRSSQPYTAFLGAWNLPLYFQIRFQEIARPLEESLQTTMQVSSSTEGAKLQATVQLLATVNLCFSPHIFLRPLAARFLKLALQAVARYGVWAGECVTAVTASEQEEEGMKRSITSRDLKSEAVGQGMRKTASSSHLSETAVARPRVDVSQLVLLYSDLELLLPLLPSTIESHLTLLLPDIQGSLHLSAVTASTSELELLLPRVTAVMVASITEQPLKLLKGVLEIPRMYRRTNRETPSKPCTYVTSLVDGLASFPSQHPSCPAPVLTDWMDRAGETIVQAFLLQVSDVLGNVAKMEESLRKLKKVRERQETREVRPGLSDDDKIRLQLYIDVHFLLRRLSEAGSKGGGSSGAIAALVDSAVEKFLPDIKQLQL